MIHNLYIINKVPQNDSVDLAVQWLLLFRLQF